jgi:hypothetical protein
MRRRSVYAGWLAVALLLSSGCSASDRTQPAIDVAEALAQRVSYLMEHNFAIEVFPVPHHTGAPPACAARVFGIDPSTATTVSEVSNVYSWVYCEERLPGGATGDQVSVPVAIHLATRPSIELPSDGEAYPASVGKIFPSDLRNIATDPPAYVEELVQQVVTTRPSPSPRPQHR